MARVRPRRPDRARRRRGGGADAGPSAPSGPTRAAGGDRLPAVAARRRPGLMDRRLAAARVWATNQMPYLASAIFACEVRDAPGSGTIAVDTTWQLHVDPE